jgi:SNF5 / SMARCB1 / INI1
VQFPLDDAGTVHYSDTITWDLLSHTALSAHAFAADCAAKFGLPTATATALEHSVAAQISAHLEREPDTIASRSVVVKGAFKHPVAARKMVRHGGSRSAKQRSALAAAAAGGSTAVDSAATAAGSKAGGSKKRTSSSAYSDSASSNAKRSRSSGSGAAAKPKKLHQQQQQQRGSSSSSSDSDSDSSNDGDEWLDDNLPCCMLCTSSAFHECECSACPRSFHTDCINSFTYAGAGPTTPATTATGSSSEDREWVCKWCVHGKGGALQPPTFKVTRLLLSIT